MVTTHQLIIEFSEDYSSKDDVHIGVHTQPRDGVDLEEREKHRLKCEVLGTWHNPFLWPIVTYKMPSNAFKVVFGCPPRHESGPGFRSGHVLTEEGRF